MEPPAVECEPKKASIPAAPPSDGPAIPAWVDEQHFAEVFKELVPGLVRIVKFQPELIGGAGENYASIMLRVNATVEVEANSAKDVSFILKTLPQGEKSAALIASFGLFPREMAIYDRCLPEFVEIYRQTGQDVAFGPKVFKLKQDPHTDYILLDNICQRGFKNINRLEGCDKEHTEAVLKLLAKFHAVSAVRYELKGQYEKVLVEGLFNERTRDMLAAIQKSVHAIFLNCLSEYKISAKLSEKVKNLLDEVTDRYIELETPDLESFNVINHGDLWANNIMFRHNDEGKVEEVLFVDFQVSRYSSPAIDLFYFLLSSTALELKVSHFDYFVQFYHEQLVYQLQLLGYPKKTPTMRELRQQLLKFSVWAFSTVMGVMSATLLDPNKDATMNNFMDEGTKAVNFKMKIYQNARYTKHFETVVPWLDRRGYLD